jgi:peroxisomal 2,4-dienoyl-CoA reductase
MTNPTSSPVDVFRDGLLRGHVAVITGGGTGICKGIARAYARLGADVCIVSRKAEVIEATARELSDETKREVLAVAADVRRPETLAEVVAKTVERFGKLDTLVNGAAGNFLSPAAELSPNGFRTVVEIDLVGSFLAARAAFEQLKASGNGLVLNITATLQYKGVPGQIHASAAKAGVDAMTRNLAVEWGPYGIRACGIAPGAIGDTEGMRRLSDEKETAKAMTLIPAARYGTVDEIAATAVYLRSAAAMYITGHTVVVDGGQCIFTPSVTGA